MKLKSWGLITGITLSSIIAGGSFDRVSAVTTTLYDGAVNATATPNTYNSPNQYLNFASLNGGSQSASGGVTTLDTSGSNSSYAGYSNYNSTLSAFVNSSFPVLDNNAGYTLSFKIDINSQTATSPNRAGFSVIVLGSDKKGIEIGFGSSDIFALNNDTGFSKGEFIAQGGILSSPNTYDLTVLGNSYTLNNGANSLLSGSLRDYSANATTLLTQVYNTANFVFLGDDTTSAGAKTNIQNIILADNNNSTAVPEPSSLVGTGLAIGVAVTLKRRLRKLRIKD